MTPQQEDRGSRLPQIDWSFLARWGRAFLTAPVAFLVTLALGALGGFLYSYAPLHSAKDWKIGYLQERLAAESQKTRELRARIDARATEAAGRPTAADLEALQSKLDEAHGRVAALETEARKAERTADAMRRERDQWKSRHAAARAERDEWKSKLEAARAEEDPWQEPPPVAKAAPAPEAAAGPRFELLAGGVVLGPGERWLSPDGEVGFEVVYVEEASAGIGLRAEGAAGASLSEPLEVRAGGEFSLGPARVMVTEIASGTAITVDVLRRVR